MDCIQIVWMAFLILLVSCDRESLGASRETETTQNPISSPDLVGRQQLPETPLVPIVPPSSEASPVGSAGRSSPVQSDDGAVLIGNYSCDLSAEDLPLGPFKLKGFGCRIFKTDDGVLRLGRTSKGLAGLQGEIRRPTENGFFLTGVFKFPGNGLTIATEMKLRQGGDVVYQGRGTGTLNSADGSRKSFELIMIKGK